MNNLNIDQYIKKNLEESKYLLEVMFRDDKVIHNLRKIALLCCSSIDKKGKIIFAGNGGSAADAQHFSTELMIRFEKERRAIPSIALNCDTTLITACSNDFGYENVFLRQLEGLATKKDVFIALSTSGQSKNVIKALQFAKSKKIKCVVFTGSNHSSIVNFSDYIIKVPSENTARIQEIHSLCGHIICGIIERYFYN